MADANILHQLRDQLQQTHELVRGLGAQQQLLDMGQQQLDVSSQQNAGNLQRVRTALETQKRSQASGILSPEQFSGDRLQDIQEWMLKYQLFAEHLGWDDPRRCRSLPLLLGGRALSWYRELPQGTQNAWPLLRQAIIAKYGPQAMGYLAEGDLSTRVQGPNETVESYSNEMIKRLNLAGIAEPLRWRYLLNGLRPAIKTFVLTQAPVNNFDECELLARRGEQIVKLQETNQRDMLSTLVGQLKDIMQSKVTPTSTATESAVTPATVAMVDRRVFNLEDKIMEVAHQQRESMEMMGDKVQEVIDGQRGANSSQNSFQRPQFPSPARTARGNARCLTCGGLHYTNACQMGVNSGLLCWYCNTRGHFIADCPQRQQDMVPYRRAVPPLMNDYRYNSSNNSRNYGESNNYGTRNFRNFPRRFPTGQQGPQRYTDRPSGNGPQASASARNNPSDQGN